MGECVLEKLQKGMFTLSMFVTPKWSAMAFYVYIRQKDHNQFSDQRQ